MESYEIRPKRPKSNGVIRNLTQLSFIIGKREEICRNVDLLQSFFFFSPLAFFMASCIGNI